MKAMVLKGPRDLGFEEVERPKPAHDQVLVRITHSGICGTDLKIYEGQIKVQHPLIMGHEMIGEVVEGGGPELKTGTRVIIDPAIYCGVCFNCRAGQTNLCPRGVLLGRDANGGFAEFMVAPRSHVFVLPDSIDNQKAPLIQVITTCMHAQRQVNVFPGEAVVVMGLGVTGQIHVQLAKARGAYPVIGVTRSPWKRKLAEELGADLTLSSGPEALKGVLDATGGRGADLIVECTGKLKVISDSVAMCRLGATMLMFGLTTVTEGALPFYQFYFKELKLINARAAKGEDYPTTIDLVARGVLKLAPLVTHVVSLSDLKSAIGMLEADEDQRMKIILEN